MTEQMVFKEKISWLWGYYKIPITGGVCLDLIVVYLASHFLTAVRDHWFYIMFADTRAEAGNGSELWRGYLEQTGYDTREKAVDFNCEAWFDYAKDNARGNRYYTLFCGLIDEGILDAVTMETESLEGIGRSGRLMDLRDDRCRNLYECYRDRLIYAIPYDTDYSTEPVPVGIDISDSILVTRYHMYDVPCAIGIGANSAHIVAVQAFLMYIF